VSYMLRFFQLVPYWKKHFRYVCPGHQRQDNTAGADGQAQASTCTKMFEAGGGQLHKLGVFVVALLLDSEGDEESKRTVAVQALGTRRVAAIAAVSVCWFLWMVFCATCAAAPGRSEADDEDTDENCEVFLHEDGTERRRKPQRTTPVEPAVVTCTSVHKVFPERKKSHRCNYCGASNTCFSL